MSEDITLPEAKLSHALDEYYAFLFKIVANNGGVIGPGQRLVTLNTITPYSIVKEKPLYNSFILRAYTDLVVRRSGNESGSPKTPPTDLIDSANSGDSWSFEYYRFMFPRLSQEMKKYIQDPAVKSEIDALEKTHDGQWAAYRAELDILSREWEAHAKENGLSETENAKKYFSKKNEFYRERKDRLQRLYDKQYATLLAIGDLELAHLDEAGLLYKQLKDNLATLNQVKLPIRPELEDSVPSSASGNPGDFDTRPAMYPAAGTNVFDELLQRSNEGDEAAHFARGYEVGREKTTKYTHDTDWGATGSARKFLFLKANLSISEKRHFEEQITKIGKIQVGFREIQDVVIVRGRWYSGAFLKSALVQKWFEQQPEFRAKLTYLITSVIVGRGLTVKLNFSTDIHQNSWRDLKTKGTGGISVSGWNFGMKGHYDDKTEWDLKDVTPKSVTFADGPNVCRVLGFKVENVLGARDPGLLTYIDDGAVVSPELIKEYASGAISYSEFIARSRGEKQ